MKERRRRDPKPSAPGRPQAVGDLLPRMLEELGLSETSRAVRLLEIWDRALGPELAPHCRPQGISRGVLYASVPDSAWMQRVALEKPRILARLAEALGEPAAQDMRLRLA